MTPGKGPSSRIVPAMTTSTRRLTHDAMIPCLITPVSTAFSMLPMPRTRLMVRR